MRVVDSHTEGEPTRLIIEGGPSLGVGPLSERRRRFAEEFDHIRRFAILEPRGYDALVGALLCEPVDPTCAAGLIFFNNAGYLGMCGHATIGAAVTLAHLGRIGLGAHRFETPVGVVRVELSDKNYATFENVESHRLLHAVSVEVDGLGRVSRRRRLGRELVFPDKRRALSAAGRKHPRAFAGRASHSARAHAGRRHRGGRRGNRPYRVLRSRPIIPTRTAVISCSAPAAPMTARPAGRGPAPSSLASPRTRSCGRANFGFRKA